MTSVWIVWRQAVFGLPKIEAVFAAKPDALELAGTALYLKAEEHPVVMPGQQRGAYLHCPVCGDIVVRGLCENCGWAVGIQPPATEQPGSPE